MKKLSLILLIAIIALSIQKKDDEENSNQQSMVIKFNQFIQSLPFFLKNLFDLIFQGGYWGDLFDLTVAELKDEAIELCVSIFPQFEGYCTSFIERLYNWFVQ